MPRTFRALRVPSQADYSGKKMFVYTSFTIQKIVAIDFSKGTYTMQLELDFKYKLIDFVKTFPYVWTSIVDRKHEGLADTTTHGSTPGIAPTTLPEIPPETPPTTVSIHASDIKYPYKVNNAASIGALQENHFFKTTNIEVLSPQKEHEPDHLDKFTSIYSNSKEDDEIIELMVKVKGDNGGNPDSDSDDPIRGAVFKCEKYSMHIECSFFEVADYMPFHDLFPYLILGSDGRPGTENVVYIHHTYDSSFPGIQDVPSIFGYEVVPIIQNESEEKIKIKVDVVDVTHAYTDPDSEDSEKVEWPRLYLIMHLRNISITQIVKYYVVPPSLFTLLMDQGLKSTFDDLDSDSIMENIMGVFLAHIALIIFVRGHSQVATSGEMAVLVNILYSVLVTHMIYFSEEVNTSFTYILYVCLDWMLMIAMLLVTWYRAKKNAEKISSASLNKPEGYALL